MEYCIPNLDCMTADELREFYLSYLDDALSGGAEKLFPDRPPGYALAATALAVYADYKWLAMSHRLAGRINEALATEREAQIMYDKHIPMYARW